MDVWIELFFWVVLRSPLFLLLLVCVSVWSSSQRGWCDSLRSGMTLLLLAGLKSGQWTLNEVGLTPPDGSTVNYTPAWPPQTSDPRQLTSPRMAAVMMLSGCRHGYFSRRSGAKWLWQTPEAPLGLQASTLAGSYPAAAIGGRPVMMSASSFCTGCSTAVPCLLSIVWIFLVNSDGLQFTSCTIDASGNTTKTAPPPVEKVPWMSVICAACEHLQAVFCWSEYCLCIDVPLSLWGQHLGQLPALQSTPDVRGSNCECRNSLV